jgi:fibronectin type 3 domain-containing protein
MKFGSPRKVAMIAVLLSSTQSLLAINAQPAPSGLPTDSKPHTVTLTWKASLSHVSGYNVYRKSKSETDHRKINSSLVQGLKYVDNSVESGATYHYVVRAVDAEGHESVNSQEFTVVIP